MKNLSYVINGILALAIIVLFVLHFTSKGSSSANEKSLVFEGPDSTATLPIAYVNVDSLLTNYNYAKDANNVLMSKVESSRASMTQKQKQLQAEQQEFQRKMQNNAFLDESRRDQEYQRIQKMAVDLEQTAGRLDNELAMEQHKVNNQLTDSVRLGIDIFNEKANYQIIFTNTGLDNILYAKDKYDITNKVLTILNGRYTSTKK